MACSSRVAEATTWPTSAGIWFGAAGTLAPLLRSGALPPRVGTRFTTCSPRSLAICTDDCTSSGTAVPGLMRMVTLVPVLVSPVELTVPTGTPLSSTSKPEYRPEALANSVVSVVELSSGLPSRLTTP